MAWLTSLADARTVLNDSDSDKLRQRKGLIGRIDGVNKVFKTFEYRRVQNFTNAVAPFGVYVNGVSVVVTADDPATGEFTVEQIPVKNDTIEATYNIQWFTDDELNALLQISTDNVGFPTIVNLPAGLKQCVLEYTKFLAYQKMAMRWSEWLSDTYKFQDEVKPDKNAADSFMRVSNQALDNFQKMRDDFYRRQGRALQPLFGVKLGTTPDVPPKR